MQYLRARYYSPASGTFNRLDPFFGRMQDPQSLHKYLYVHGDPVNGLDPTGLRAGGMGLGGMLATFGIITALSTVTSTAVFDAAGRSRGYGAITGFVGGSALSTAIILQEPLPRVLTEAVLSTVFALGAIVGLDHLLGKDLGAGKWEYVSYGLEAFNWSAAGAMWLNTREMMGDPVRNVGADDPQLIREMAMALSLTGSAAQAMSGALGGLLDVTIAGTHAIYRGGLTPAEETKLRSEITDSVSTICSVFLSVIPNMLAAGAFSSVPGLRYLPPSLLGRVTGAAIELVGPPLVGGIINAVSEEVGGRTADVIIAALDQLTG
jgi:hypothetical protein